MTKLRKSIRRAARWFYENRHSLQFLSWALTLAVLLYLSLLNDGRVR